MLCKKICPVLKFCGWTSGSQNCLSCSIGIRV